MAICHRKKGVNMRKYNDIMETPGYQLEMAACQAISWIELGKPKPIDLGKCPECGSDLERDPVHKLCMRCSKCDYWCGFHPPSPKVQPIDLGCANGWAGDDYPAIVDECIAQGHILTETEIRQCYHRISCEICGYFYTSDSSD